MGTKNYGKSQQVLFLFAWHFKENTLFIFCCFQYMELLPWSNAFWPGLTPFGPPMWQAEADTELTLSASPTRAVGQKALALAKKALFHGTT